VARSFHQLGMVAKQFDRFGEAERYYLQALEIRTAALGPEHSDVAITYNNLANLMTSLHRYADSLAYAEKAMAIWLRVYGPKSRAMARTLSIAGHTEKAQGHFARAEAYYRRALEIRLAYSESDPLSVMSSHEDLGEALVGQRRFREGLQLLEQALTRALAPDVDAYRRGEARFAFAKALIRTQHPDHRRRGLELARQALDDFRAPQDVSERREVEAFVAAHAGPSVPASPSAR
jgi:tetratricopeptide (TPR) repeat protein